MGLLQDSSWYGEHNSSFFWESRPRLMSSLSTCLVSDLSLSAILPFSFFGWFLFFQLWAPIRMSSHRFGIWISSTTSMCCESPQMESFLWPEGRTDLSQTSTLEGFNITGLHIEVSVILVLFFHIFQEFASICSWFCEDDACRRKSCLHIQVKHSETHLTGRKTPH